jgi:hypothetical protein
LEKGEKLLDEKIINNFSHNPKELLKDWYKLKKVFKSRWSREYPTNLLQTPYQYEVAMLCRIYGEPDAQRFMITWVPLKYYVVDVRSTFNWDEILSSSLE